MRYVSSIGATLGAALTIGVLAFAASPALAATASVQVNASPGAAGAGVPAAMQPLLASRDCASGGPTAADAALASQLSSRVHSDRMDGVNAGQISCARVITETVSGDGLPSRAALLAVMTAMAESTLHDYTESGDHDSLGLYQQRPSSGWGTPSQIEDPVYATNAFLSAMKRKFPDNTWMTGDPGAICQKVQVSAAPDEYDRQEAAAEVVVDALWNNSGDGSEISPVYNATAVVDVSGDGIADLLATTPDGKLWYYPNNFGTNPDGTPFTTKKLVGSGWQGFNHVTAGDLNQDGHADILATKPDGTLWYYQNSQNSDDPYTTGTQIGYGFQQYNRILAADVSGDGAADLIAVKPDGTLWFYPNNSTTNPNHTPFTTANQIGYGFQEYNRLTTADINGDGFDDLIASNVDGTLTEYENTQAFSSPYDQPSQIGYGFQEYSSITAGDITADGHADLITIKPDGTLWEYPNNSGTNPGHIPYTSPNQIGYGWTGFANIF